MTNLPSAKTVLSGVTVTRFPSDRTAFISIIPSAPYPYLAKTKKNIRMIFFRNCQNCFKLIYSYLNSNKIKGSDSFRPLRTIYMITIFIFQLPCIQSEQQVIFRLNNYIPCILLKFEILCFDFNHLLALFINSIYNETSHTYIVHIHFLVGLKHFWAERCCQVIKIFYG